MSSFTPVETRSTSPTFPFLLLPLPLPPPLPPFGLFSSAIRFRSKVLSFRAPCLWREESAFCFELHSRQECSRIVKFAGLSLGPRIQLRGIHQDLSVGREFDVGTVHGTRCGPFEVDAFAVISTAVA